MPGEGNQLRSPELLVLAAETAVKNGEFNLAREACHEFFLDGGGARDQFFCRALFVKVLNGLALSSYALSNAVPVDKPLPVRLQ